MAERRRSLKRRFFFWFGLLFLLSTIGLRVVHYRAAAELLARDLDVAVWSRLAELKAAEQADPGILGQAGRAAALLPAMPAAPTTAVTLVAGSSPQGLPPLRWFAGVWQADGTLTAALDLPGDLAWEPGWQHRRDSLWTVAGRYRLAATAGPANTLIVAGTPLADLVAARRRTAAFQAWTFLVWAPLLLGIGWLLFVQVLAPLTRIGATARQIQAGRFDERIDLTRADAEYVDVADTLNAMLDRLDQVRGAQARFNADVAHQLLNPVHGILLEADVAGSRDRSPADSAESLRRVAALARRIESLCETLLTYSRSAAVDPARLQPVDLEPILEEAAEQLLPRAAERGIRIDLPPAGTIVTGDAELLREVFVNLLANAVAHSPAGGRIEIAAARDAEAVRVAVIDHGPGVPPDDVPHLFERFFSSHREGGHGVGLALCQTILRGHGGEILHRPTPGGGATFEAMLPGS